MRNLSEYPITLDEKIEAIQWAIGADQRDWVASGKPIGGVRNSALCSVLVDLLAERKEQ